MNELIQEIPFWDDLSRWVYTKEMAALNFLAWEKSSASVTFHRRLSGKDPLGRNFFVLVSFSHIWLFQLLAKATKQSILHSLIVRRVSSSPLPGCQEQDRCLLVSSVLEWSWTRGAFSPLSFSQCLDASRPWLCYWILHSWELLDEPIPQMVATEWVWFWGTYHVLWNCILNLDCSLLCFCLF